VAVHRPPARPAAVVVGRHAAGADVELAAGEAHAAILSSTSPESWLARASRADRGTARDVQVARHAVDNIIARESLGVEQLTLAQYTVRDVDALAESHGLDEGYVAATRRDGPQ
jgi:hypothetical protein